MTKRFALMLFGLGCLLVLSGCDFFDGKTRSPFTGQPATGQEIVTQAKAEVDAKTAEAKEQAEKAQAAAARRKAEFDRAVATLDAETRIKLAEMQALYEVEMTETAGKIERIKADTERAIAMVNGLTKNALDAIETEKANLGAVLNLAEGGAGLIPIAGLSGIVGLITGHLRGRYVGERRGWDEAKTETETAVKERDAHYDMGQQQAAFAAALAALTQAIGGQKQPPASQT